jgi:hypothetical protein
MTWNNKSHSNKTKEEIDKMIAKSANILRDPSEYVSIYLFIYLNLNNISFN